MEMSPLQAAHCARLNDADRTRYIAKLQFDKQQALQKAAMLEDLKLALKCAEEGKDHPRLRTQEKKKKWMESSIEKRLNRYFDFRDAVERNHQIEHAAPDNDSNPAYPQWTDKHFHGD